jgi:hypothetical protein
MQCQLQPLHEKQGRQILVDCIWYCAHKSGGVITIMRTYTEGMIVSTCTCKSWHDCAHLCTCTCARSQLSVPKHVGMFAPNIKMQAQLRLWVCTHKSMFALMCAYMCGHDRACMQVWLLLCMCVCMCWCDCAFQYIHMWACLSSYANAIADVCLSTRKEKE